MSFVNISGALFFLMLVLDVHNAASDHLDPIVIEGINESDTIRSRSKRSIEMDITSVPMNGKIKRHRVNTPIVPETHKNIMIGNVGKSDINVEAKYGLGIISGYIGLVDKLTLKPGQKAEIHFTRSFFKTAVVFKNPNNTRGIVYSWTKGWPQGAKVIGHVKEVISRAQFDFMKYVRIAVLGGLNKVPYVGSILKGILEEYWPPNKKDKWAEEMEKLQQKLNDVQVSLVEGILKTNLKGYKNRFETLIRESNNGLNIISHYMNIAEDMIELDGIFFLDEKDKNVGPNVNYFTLPLFSCTINLKISFYTWGITFADKIGLTGELLTRVKNFRSESIENAVRYVEDFNEIQENRSYETCNPAYFYNEMMKTRTHLTVHGLDYIPHWQNIIDPKKYPMINNHISYSEFYGTSTLSLYNLTMNNYKAQPLTPNLVPVSPGSSVMRRNKLKTVEMFSCWNDRHTLCGMKVRFENNDEYPMGTCEGSRSIMELNGARINKMRVGGAGAVDYIEFHLSDGRYLQYGKGGTRNYVDYELIDHHIVSIFVSNDTNQLARQLANIAVSYQQNPVDDD